MDKRIVVTVVLAMLSACASGTSAVKSPAEPPRVAPAADVGASVKTLCTDFAGRDPARWKLAMDEKQAGTKVQQQYAIVDKGNGTLVQVIVYDSEQVSPMLTALFASQLLKQNRINVTKIELSDEQGTKASFTLTGTAPDGHSFSGTVIAQAVGAKREKTVFLLGLWPETAAKEMAPAVDSLAAAIGAIK